MGMGKCQMRANSGIRMLMVGKTCPGGIPILGHDTWGNGTSRLPTSRPGVPCSNGLYGNDARTIMVATADDALTMKCED